VERLLDGKLWEERISAIDPWVMEVIQVKQHKVQPKYTKQ
jgi:hypothetical protein